VEDRYDLQRFVDAQDRFGMYDVAVSELRRGHKESHWMWFIFPQVVGLGGSSNATRYGIRSLDEARAYLDHPVLGPRLRECAGLVQQTERHSATQIFGSIDSMKLRSSMTLFMRARHDERVFADVLDRYFEGVGDQRTDELLTGLQ